MLLEVGIEGKTVVNIATVAHAVCWEPERASPLTMEVSDEAYHYMSPQVALGQSSQGLS